MQIKTDQFAEAAREALKDTYTRIFLDGLHRKVKERLASMGTFPDPAAARKLGAAIRATPFRGMHGPGKLEIILIG